MRLVSPTSDTRVILEAVQAATAAMYRPNTAWKKAGVGLVDLSAQHIQQTELFAPVRNPKSEALMKVLDAANLKFGRGSVQRCARQQTSMGHASRASISGLHHPLG